MRDIDRDFGARPVPKPEELLADLVRASEPDTRGEHVWVMALVYEVPGADDQAQRLSEARHRRPDLYHWEPGDAVPVELQGPFCAACGKIRGPLPVRTKCGEERPAWLRKREAVAELAGLPRPERRRLSTKAARAERRVRRAMGPSPRDLARAAQVRVAERPEWWPCAVAMTDPELVEPAQAAIA